MTIRQAVQLAASGMRVAIIGRGAPRLVDEAMVRAEDHTRLITTRRANGRQSIDFHRGGRLSFHRQPVELRGVELDVAYLTDIGDVEAGALDELAPCFATRPRRIGALV